ncbi:MAG: dihydrolipoyl dehydrogenase [Haliea sp.]|uniref:dihydrolipoyl dehydrogenase n=1 Tax=Haliea sp. TaxID=1932666 RepID=UPI0032EB5482
MPSSHWDLIVIGGGPAGYVAAIRAAQLGLQTALVERDALGGICLNWGCIPTKAMLHGAEVAHTLVTAQELGFAGSGGEPDFAGIVRHSRRVADQLAGGVDHLLRQNDVTVLRGSARVVAKGEIILRADDGGERHFFAEHIVIATGASPRELSGLAFDGEQVWSYFEALAPADLPSSLLVIGSGAIGVEFASLYADLGTSVTVVEQAPRILPLEDEEISRHLQRAFEKRGIRVLTGHRVVDVTEGEQGRCCQLESIEDPGCTSETIEVERILVAAGVLANVAGLGLEALSVELRDGFIATDAWGRTNVADLYAVGDVAGAPCLAHKATHQAVRCVEHLAGVPDTPPLDLTVVPGCTYSRPQVASVGLTEAKAVADGRRIRTGRFNMQANGRALAMREGDGMVKVVVDDDTGELLGAHMIGPEVTEQIQAFTVARHLEATDVELARVVFAHPTLSESMHEAVLDAMGKALHQ